MCVDLSPLIFGGESGQIVWELSLSRAVTSHHRHFSALVISAYSLSALVVVVVVVVASLRSSCAFTSATRALLALSASVGQWSTLLSTRHQ